MLIASIGLLANLISAWALIDKVMKNNVNLRSAYLHVLGDALGSVGALVAGALMSLFSWYIADPIISVVVALLILKKECMGSKTFHSYTYGGYTCFN